MYNQRAREKRNDRLMLVAIGFAVFSTLVCCILPFLGGGI